MRKIIIAGNWKMNKTIPESVNLAKEIVEAARGITAVDIVICPTYPALDRVNGVVMGSNVKLGAQDMHWTDQGAYTGKVSADILKDAGVEYAILGHSEQRTYFNETNEGVNQKTIKALASNLIPIICVGETLEERETNKTEAVVKEHVTQAYKNISKADARKTIIAYEPVWAIGTGKTASPEQAQDVHKFIRGLLAELYDTETAETICIQYGGSMKPDNAKELLSKPDVDGGLIGGAALKADSFLGIVKAGV